MGKVTFNANQQIADGNAGSQQYCCSDCMVRIVAGRALLCLMAGFVLILAIESRFKDKLFVDVEFIYIELRKRVTVIVLVMHALLIPAVL